MNNPSLKICGNPIGSGGYCDIYDLDGSHITIPNQGKEGMSDVSYYIIVRVTKYDAQYVYVPNVEVRSFNGTREATLKMGISIPKDYRLKGGVSPYHVLMDVYETMKKENLSEISGTGILQYNEKMCDASVFGALLQKYPLEEFKSAFRPMTGSSAALLVTNRISEFMKDPHYPELQQYSEVIVATAGAYPVRVPDLQIPRIPQFSLYVNGELKGERLNANSPIEPIRWSSYNERCYDVPSPIKISMFDIINNRSWPQGVNVDWENERIDCTLPKPLPRTETWYVKIDSVHNAQTIFNGIRIYLTTKDGSMQVNVNTGGVFIVQGEQITAPKRVSYNGADYDISFQSENANQRQIYVKMRKKNITPPTPTNKPQIISIILPAKAIEESRKEHSGVIKWYLNGDGDKSVYYCAKVRFNPQSGKKDVEKVELWFSEVSLPSFLQTSNGQWYIYIKTKKATYEGNVKVENKNQYQRRNRPEIKSDAESYLDLGDKKWESISFLQRHLKLIFYLFTLLLVFVIGITLGIRAGKNQVTTVHDGPGNVHGKPVENQDSIKASALLEQYGCLDNDSVTFKEIDSLYDAMNNLPDEVRSYLPDWELMENRTKAYYNIVEEIRNATVCDKSFVDTLKNDLEKTKAYGNDNLPTNLDYCRYLYKPDRYNSSKEKLKQAQDNFIMMKEKGEINSFTDIKSITEMSDSVQSAQSTLKQNGSITNTARKGPKEESAGGPGGEH